MRPNQTGLVSLANLGTVLNLAHEAKLQVMPTFFTGMMSGINWWPSWALAEQEEAGGIRRVAAGKDTLRIGRDPYVDPFMLQAECLLVRTVCRRYAEHPAIYAWNFSNEPDLFAVPKSYQDGANWNRFLADEVHKHSPLPFTAGMQLGTISSYNGFRPDMLAPYNSFITMHGYSIYYHLVEREEPLNSDVVPLACLVTEALGAKPVLFEEFGYASSELGDVSEFKPVQRCFGIEPQYFADDVSGGLYYRQVLTKLARCGSLGACAWMWSDYDPHLWSAPPFDDQEHERFFGLTRWDGSLKPSAEAMRDFAERVASGDLPERTVQPLSLDPDLWYEDPATHFDNLFRAWRGRI